MLKQLEYIKLKKIYMQKYDCTLWKVMSWVKQNLGWAFIGKAVLSFTDSKKSDF